MSDEWMENNILSMLKVVLMQLHEILTHVHPIAWIYYYALN